MNRTELASPSFPIFCATISEGEQLVRDGVRAAKLQREGCSTSRDRVHPAAPLTSCRNPGNVGQSLLPPAFRLLSPSEASWSQPAWKSRGDAAAPSRTQLPGKMLPSPLCTGTEQAASLLFNRNHVPSSVFQGKPLLGFPCVFFPTARNGSVPLSAGLHHPKVERCEQDPPALQ